MPKRPDAYYRPETLPEALNLLSKPDTIPLAGGTKLLTGDVDGAVVDLQNLGLNQVEQVNEHLLLGATLTLDALAAWLQERTAEGPAELLQNAIQLAGPNTYRHAATLGGTAAGRLPDSELLAALLVLDATLHLQIPESTTMPLADYLAAAERPFGLITQLTISWQGGQGAAERVARTPADYPIVSVTGWQPTGETPRLAATGIGSYPARLTQAEAALAQGEMETAVLAAQSACRHPGDFRGDADYRKEITAVLTRRVLSRLL